MNWLFYALLTPALYAAVTFIDKYLIEAEVEDYNAMPIYMGLVGGLAGVVIFALTGMPVLPLQDTLLILGTGILTCFAYSLYFKAVSLEEAGHINFLFQTFPVITLVLSFAILGERISSQQLIGFIIILTAVISVTKKKGDRFFELSPAFFLILLNNFLWAISSILIKFAFNISTFTDVVIYESFGVALGALIIYITSQKIRQAFRSTHAKLTRKAQILIFTTESLNLLGKAFMFFAFSIGPVALVSIIIEGSQTFIAIGFGLILGMLLPKIFKEEAHIPDLPKKLACAALAVIGVYLLT
jgi:uncharacterized membrane protein